MLPEGINHRKGRAGKKIEAIVIHISTSTMASMTSWFNNPVARASAHYGVSKAGEVVQYVDEADTAFHAGKKVRPKAPLVLRLGGNPNLYTVGIEHEGTGATPPPTTQLKASARLVAEIATRHKIPIDAEHVIRHDHIRVDKRCPGVFDVESLINLARLYSKPEIGERRHSKFLGEDIILTEYVSDTEYKFVRVSQLKGLGQPGSSPWSSLDI